jgi:hypothetical protein
MRDDERAVEESETPDSMPGDDAADDDLVESYGEAADEAYFDDDSDEEPRAESEALTELEAEASAGGETACEPTSLAPVFNNFMDVLYPANPPAAKNPRIVRRFDLEAAKYDPRPMPAPGSAPAPAPEPSAAPSKPEKKEPALTREEQRAMRNRSLRAAAGLG